MVINRGVDHPGSAGGRSRDVYIISFNQFEELMSAAQTSEGKKACKLVLKVERNSQEYIGAEHEAAKAIKAARANALQQQLDGLRAQQQHLDVFRLFGNCFKIVIAKDVDRRIKAAQHILSIRAVGVPRAYLVQGNGSSASRHHEGARCLDQDGVYKLSLSDSKIRALFDCLARKRSCSPSPHSTSTPPSSDILMPFDTLSHCFKQADFDDADSVMLVE